MNISAKNKVGAAVVSAALSYVFFCFVFFTFSSCTPIKTSSLPLRIEEKSGNSLFLSLKALNKDARCAHISAPDKSPYMYFVFDEKNEGIAAELHKRLNSGCYALELELESFVSAGNPASDGSALGEREAGMQKGKGLFFVSFLYADDFLSSESLKKKLNSRFGVKAFIKKSTVFKLSIGFENSGLVKPSGDIKGFIVYSAVPVKIKRADIKKARYGWIKNDTGLWFGFSSGGGIIDTGLLNEEKVPEKTFFLETPALPKDSVRELHVLFRPQQEPVNSFAVLPSVCLMCGSNALTVSRSPALQSAIFDSRFFPDGIDSVQIASGEGMIEGLVLEQVFSDPLTPITADPGLVVNWPRKNWRNKEFEFFSWQQFPSVLIFDIADYTVQDAFFKRLAFFVEKKGFTGKLLTDGQIRALHAFNAHDYRAESLAAFFDKAEKESFILNKAERCLRDILLANNVIVSGTQGITAGSGALVSISRESPRRLRQLLLTHECLHGIYFTEASFREKADEVFDAMDSLSLLFLKRYFEVMPSLTYNTADIYLLKNEFMAYTLQQSVLGVKNYFTSVLAHRNALRAVEPELCAYIRETQAAAFTEAAEIMSDFLYQRWGISGGRVSLFSVD